jgi:hypothetical protein
MTEIRARAAQTDTAERLLRMSLLRIELARARISEVRERAARAGRSTRPVPVRRARRFGRKHGRTR